MASKLLEEFSTAQHHIDACHSFSERLNHALDIRHYPLIGKGRINYVQEVFSISRAGANKWIHGKAIPHKNTREKIASILGINLAWLETGKGDPLTQDQEQFSALSQTFEIPLFDMLEVINFQKNLNSNHVGEKIVVSNLPKHVFAVKLIGNSMLPKFSSNSILIVDPNQMISDGDYVLGKVRNLPESIFRQYILGAAGSYLIAINPKFEPIFLDLDSVLIGKVVEVRENFN